jgi:hypothetical protein
MAAVSDPPGTSRPLERFPCSSRVLGLVTLAAMAVVVVLVLLDGSSLTHVAIIAGIVLFGIGVWLTMVRPAVDLHKDHVLVRNALTDIAVPWHLVKSVEVRQVLVIRTDERAVHGIAVGRSARQQLRRGRGGPGPGPLAAAGRDALGQQDTFRDQHGLRIDYADAVALRIENLAPANRRQSERLTTVDKRWRLAELLVVIGVAITFGLLLTLAIAA